MISHRSAARLAAPVCGALLLGACASVPGEYRLAERDPLEKVNRGVWSVNQAADKVLIKPATKAYRAVAPRPVRQGVSNIFANLTEPWSFVNNLLQGKPDRSGRNLVRFVVNSTVGILGVWDPARKMGVRPASEDLGQTLAVWGINGGPYVVLPLLGPSTLRDGIGSGVAAYADPVRIGINHADINVWYKRGYLATYIVSARSDLIESGGDAFLESSLDPYAAARSAYLQLRRAEIRDQDDNGAPGAALPGQAGTPSSDSGTMTAPSSSAPLPGDDAAPAPAGTEPASTAPLPGDPASSPAPVSSAPLPGDDAPQPTPAPKG